MSSSVQDIYNDIQQQREAMEQQNRLNVANMVAPDYDRAARIFAVEANTLLPYHVVDADLENLEEQLRRGRFDSRQYTDAANGSPVFNEFAAEHPYHIAVLDRDWANLTGIERATKQVLLSWDAGWATSEINDIRDRQLAEFQDPNREEDKQRLDELHDLLEGGNFGADTWYMKVLAGTSQQIPIQAYLIGESLDEVAIGAATGAGIGGYMGGLPGAITGLTVGIGRGFMVGRTEAAFRLERNLAYDQYIGAGLDEEEARWASLVVGSIAGAAESFGAGVLLKRIPGFDKIMNDKVGGVINSVMTKPTVKQAIARTSMMYGEGVATELVTETFQDATVIVGEEWLKKQARGRGDIRDETRAITWEEFGSQMADTAVHTLYATVLLAGVGPGFNAFRDSRRIRTANRRLAAFEAMGEHASKSETRKNVPNKYREFVERLAGKDGKVLIEARRFIDYFQEIGMDAEEVAISVGVNNLTEAETNGHDIQIPAGQYLEKIAPTQHHNGLIRDLKTHPGQLSANEAQIVDKNMQLAIKELQELTAKQDPEQARIDAKIIETFKAQLIENGMSPEAAEHQAMFMVGIPNLARRANLDPEQFMEDRFGGIISTTNAQMRADKEDFNIHVDPYLNKIRAGDYPSQRKIFGPDLIERILASGGLATDPELDARDMKKLFSSLFRGDKGRTLDDVAEFLHEEGYIKARDPWLVLDALDRAAGGELIHGDQFTIDEVNRELADSLESLSEMLDRAGIDITDMTNKEVRDAIDAIETYYQTDDKIDTTQLNMLTKIALESAEHDPQMMARAQSMLPDIGPEQDFGDIKFAEDYTLRGKRVTGTISANAQFKLATERRDSLKMLKKCLSRG